MLAYPQIDPVALAIGPLKIHWYGLMYLVGIGGAWLLLSRRLQAFDPQWSKEKLSDLVFWSAMGVILGGRLGYVLFYDLPAYVHEPLKMLRVWEGGMSFHGGFLGVVVAALLFGRSIGCSLDRMLDLGAASVPVGLGLGRLANFINGELWGRPTDLPWGMVFPHDELQVPRHPSQLYEAILEGLVLFLAVRIGTHRYGALQHPGRAAGIFALVYGLSRILSECFREPDAFLGYFGGFLTMGMILSLPLCAVGVWLLLRSRHEPA